MLPAKLRKYSVCLAPSTIKLFKRSLRNKDSSFILLRFLHGICFEIFGYIVFLLGKVDIQNVTS